MSKAFKILFSLPLIIGIITILAINVNLYDSPRVEILGKDTVNTDLLKQLSFLEHALANHADSKMQNLYPEGYVFMNALYGLTWCNVLEKSDKHISYNEKGHDQIQLAFNKINSDTGRTIFDESLPLPYGAFYTGWNNYLLGRKLSLEDPLNRDSTEINQFKKQCNAIASAIAVQPYPESYYGGVWPADAMVCVASLVLHDAIYDPIYSEHLVAWIKKVKSNLDPNGLIPHAIHANDQTIAENARGSSLSLMLIFLKEIDNEFATEQFKLYKSKFCDTRLGLTGIREYPKGEFGSGDIDSGPVVLEMGGAATIVGVQTLSLFGEHEISDRIRSTLEALGFPIETKNERFYLFRQLPMVDAFAAWSESAFKPSDQHQSLFIRFHLYSIIAIVLFSCGIRWLWKRKSEQ